MAGRGRSTWAGRWCGLLASVALITLGRADGSAEEGEQNPTNQGCPSTHSDRHLMLVSTMDGRVTALNVGNEGSLAWDVEAGESLVSSSIGNIELMRDGVKTRLIPSLDGALYQFDGENVEALPFTADTLLSSSFKFTDDSTIVGGKEATTYGIDPATGKLKYMCSMSGCKKFSDDGAGSSNAQDVLIITRNTKTVRSVEMSSGAEKWNFSVGQHELKFAKGTPSMNRIEEDYAKTNPSWHHVDIDEEVDVDGEPDAQDKKDADDDDAEIYTCVDDLPEDEDWFSWFMDAAADIDLRVIVPKGLIMAFKKNDPTHLLWQRQFDTAINGAWMLEKGELSQIDLFDERNVPALGLDMDSEVVDEPEEVPLPPLMYVGLHQGQMYVQPSVQLVAEVESTIKQGTTTEVAVYMPKVRWRPYLATASSRTPAEVHPRNPLLLGYDKDAEPGLEVGEDNGQGTRQGGVTWHDQYPFDGGFYIFPDTTPIQLNPALTNSTRGAYAGISLYLWHWWKEVGALSVFIAILMHMFMMKLSAKKKCIAESPQHMRAHSTSIADQITELQNLSEKEKTYEVEDKSADYSSRFYSEFVQLACLGRGGFGVVFESSNKMDDCKYAIKRITLNDSDKARERVMREVKALAKLDNSGIVRYYQAWFECPPPGWQEEKDRQCIDLESTSTTPMISSTGMPSHHVTPKISPLHTPVKTPQFLNFNQKNPFKLDSTLDYSKPFGGNSKSDQDSDWSQSQVKKVGSSDGFTPTLHEQSDDSESEGLSEMTSPHHSIVSDHSSSINFVDSSVSRSCSTHLPFKPYESKLLGEHSVDGDHSFSVIFEDSGCAEKSTTDDISKGSHQEYSQNNCNLTSMEEGGVRSHRKHKSHRRSKSFDETSSFSSHKIDSSFKPRSYDDSIHIKHDAPQTLDILSMHDEVHRKDSNTTTPSRKLYLYIQMQLCQRASLKDWMMQNPVNREIHTVLDILDQIVCAVNYIHDSGLMHRDLKPSNIFFSLDGVVKVGDFGLVTELEDQCIGPEPDETPYSPYRKHTDQVGTKLYMSPEQAQGGIYSQKVDIYALGVIFFEMFFPFGTQTERVMTLMRVRQQNFPDSFVGNMPEESAYVKRMLSPSPADRPSAKDILQSPLLIHFETARQALRVRKTTHRTISTSSSSSGGLSLLESNDADALTSA